MKNRSVIYFSIFFFLMICQPAFSQTTYTFNDLVKKANDLSQTIKIAEEDVNIALQEKKRALSVLIPRVTTFGSATRYNEEDMAMPNTTTVGIKLTQSFTLNGRELIALDVTKQNIIGKQYNLESVRSQYLLQVSHAYYNILSAMKFVEIAQSDVKRLTGHKDAVNEKLNVGNVTKTDLYRAQAELSKSMTELVKAQNGVLQAKAALLNLVDLEPDFEFAVEKIEGIQNYNASLEDIQAFALKQRPEILEAGKNLEIARKTVRFEKSDYWPSISLEAGYKETRIEYEAPPADTDYDTEDLYLTAELVFTLFDGGLRNAQIRQALSNVKKAEHALALQKKKVIMDSKVSFLEYDTAKNTLHNLKDELKSAQENYNAVQMQFKYGMADSIDMMDANTLLVSAQRRISDATYQYYLSVLKILHTKGDLTRFLKLASN